MVRADPVLDAERAASVSVVVVAYGPDPWLEPCVHAILGSTGAAVEVILVDNGGTRGIVERLAELPGLRAVSSGGNVGFAAGCHLGVEAATAPVVAFLNPDTMVAPAAVAELAAVAQRPSVGLATASVRLADRPDRINSAGNEIHFLGMSWAGHYGEPADRTLVERPVTAASGAAMACRRSVWEALGGFEPRFFAYCEDADLSLRAWQRGLEVRFVPSAVVWHRYEFSRNAAKLMLLERNRLVVVLTCFGSRQLAVTLPALLAFETFMLLYALLGGWFAQKLAGYSWLMRHRRWLRHRRAAVQSARLVPERVIADLLSSHLRPQNHPIPRFLSPVDRILAGYWAVVRRII